MLYKNYTYTANIEATRYASEFLRNSEVLGHVRFMHLGETIYELMYLRTNAAPQYLKLEWSRENQIAIDTLDASDMDADEVYYIVVYDIKEICTETPQIDDVLIMHDSINIRNSLWDYVRGIYASVHWRQDNIVQIPNYISGFLRNIYADESAQCNGNTEHIPLLSALIYSHGIYAISDLLDITSNRECLLDINDPYAPLFAFWNMLEGEIRKKIWIMFDIVDIYYDENYRIMQFGPVCEGRNLLEHMLDGNDTREIRNYIAEIRDPDWLEYCGKCGHPIFDTRPAVINMQYMCYYKLCLACVDSEPKFGSLRT